MRYSYLYGATGSPSTYSLSIYRDKTRFVLVALVASLLVFGLIGSQLANARTPVVQALPNSESQGVETTQEPIPDPASAQAIAVQTSAEEKAAAIDISAWLLSHKGAYSVSMYDEAGRPLVDVNSGEQYFMASIYKLYVAYLGYQKMDIGVWADDANYWTDWTRTKCLDQMVRSSHSPCGEKMMAEIGKTNIQEKLNDYGLENTSFKKFVTSSGDVANLLVRLQKNLDLSIESKQKLLDSMSGQIYRDGMPDGFSEWPVADKVGFNGNQEYHDVGIVTSPAGKTYVVAMLTNNAGTDNIANLAKTIKDGIR